MFIRYCHSQLYNLEHVDITSHCLIMVVCTGLETSYWACYDTWKLGVLTINTSLDEMLVDA